MKNPFAPSLSKSDQRNSTECKGTVHKAYYKCPECDFYTTKWPLLKGHMKRQHSRDDLKNATAEAFADYEISEREFNAINRALKPESSAPSPGVPPNDFQIQVTITIRGGKYDVL